MKRREFIAASAALLVSPRRSWAQGTPRRVGMLGNFHKFADPKSVPREPARSRLDRGQEPDHRVPIFRGHAERMPALAAELVALKPDLLIATNPQTAVALKSATASIPIVFVAVADPVRLGLVQSLSRPGGNITGLCTLRARKFRQQSDTNPAGNGSYRLENCDLGQSGQSNSQADSSRGVAPNGPETRRGSADS